MNFGSTICQLRIRKCFQFILFIFIKDLDVYSFNFYSLFEQFVKTESMIKMLSNYVVRTSCLFENDLNKTNNVVALSNIRIANEDILT